MKLFLLLFITKYKNYSLYTKKEKAHVASTARVTFHALSLILTVTL